jgi:NADH:ubiquinone oxidoreductase subunit K
MVALRGLLFALFAMALTAIVSLIVVGIINITYRIGHRKKVSGKIQK